MSEELREAFTENAEQFDALMVKMLAVNVAQAQEILALKAKVARLTSRGIEDMRYEIDELTKHNAAIEDEVIERGEWQLECAMLNTAASVIHNQPRKYKESKDES